LKDAKEGSVVGGGNERGKQPNQFRYPQNLSFDRENNLYVIDCRNHRVSKFCLDLS
jgi:DNA-binding beta-propeller fold protein YncE